MGREIYIYKLSKNKENEELIKKLNSDTVSEEVWETFMNDRNLRGKPIELIYTSFTKSFANEFMIQLGEFEFQFGSEFSKNDEIIINPWYGKVIPVRHFNIFLDYLIIFSYLFVESESQDITNLSLDLEEIKSIRGQVFVEKIKNLYQELINTINYRDSRLFSYSETLVDTCIYLKQFTKEENSTILILDSN